MNRKDLAIAIEYAAAAIFVAWSLVAGLWSGMRWLIGWQQTGS